MTGWTWTRWPICSAQPGTTCCAGPTRRTTARTRCRLPRPSARLDEPAQVAAAMSQVALRRAAATKLGADAAVMFFTRDTLEQATQLEVAHHPGGAGDPKRNAERPRPHLRTRRGSRRVQSGRARGLSGRPRSVDSSHRHRQPPGPGTRRARGCGYRRAAGPAAVDLVYVDPRDGRPAAACSTPLRTLLRGASSSRCSTATRSSRPRRDSRTRSCRSPSRRSGSAWTDSCARPPCGLAGPSRPDDGRPS